MKSPGCIHRSGLGKSFRALDSFSHLPESNRGPRDYKSRALPTELRWPLTTYYKVNNEHANCVYGESQLGFESPPHYLHTFAGFYE
jgi:hypothetical protein